MVVLSGDLFNTLVARRQPMRQRVGECAEIVGTAIAVVIVVVALTGLGDINGLVRARLRRGCG